MPLTNFPLGRSRSDKNDQPRGFRGGGSVSWVSAARCPDLLRLGQRLAARRLQPHRTEAIRPKEAVSQRRRYRHARLFEGEELADEIPPRAVLSVEEAKVEVLSVPACGEAVGLGYALRRDQN